MDFSWVFVQCATFSQNIFHLSLGFGSLLLWTKSRRCILPWKQDENNDDDDIENDDDDDGAVDNDDDDSDDDAFDNDDDDE